MTFETIGPDHPVSQIANRLSDQALTLAATARISRWDLCIAMANACGQILSDAANVPTLPAGITMPQRGRNMPRQEAMKRMDDLRTIMQSAYELRNVEGEA